MRVNNVGYGNAVVSTETTEERNTHGFKEYLTTTYLAEKLASAANDTPFQFDIFWEENPYSTTNQCKQRQPDGTWKYVDPVFH